MSAQDNEINRDIDTAEGHIVVTSAVEKAEDAGVRNLHPPRRRTGRRSRRPRREVRRRRRGPRHPPLAVNREFVS